jgi:site-specific recombinase
MPALHPLLEAVAAAPDSSDPALLVELVAALRPAHASDHEDARNRLCLLIDVLRSRPHLALALRAYLASVLAARNHSFFFAESGILGNTGFFSELRHRIANRILPPALDARFLSDLFDELFVRDDDAQWLAAVPDALWLELLAALGMDQGPLDAGQLQLRHEIGEALRVLACRLAALGLEPEMVRYYPALAQYESPFMAQQREIELLVLPVTAGDTPPDQAHAAVLLTQCREALQRIRKLSHEGGAAVKLSWHLMRAQQIIERMDVLLDLLLPEAGAARLPAASRFFCNLVEAESRRGSVRELIRDVTDLLSLQVTEHASRTGEHYVTRGRGEFFAMFRAAAGAGVIVAGMALCKNFIATLHLPPAWEALGFSLNYGLGFVLVHLMGFTIATKQPAMTAATLAATIGQQAAGAVEEMGETIIQVCRSQFIAIAGNVLLAFVTSLAVAWAWGQAFGGSPLTGEKAVHVLHDLHPWLSMALPHAAIAGVCLFLTGLISGYYDNKAIYNRVPDRLRRVRWLRHLLGAARQERLAVYVEHNLGALAGNLFFGFMLGCMGTLGFMLGLPLDIRHVTFGAANLAYGLAALDFQLPWQDVLTLALGVGLIGLTNLAVSFALAMKVALKSRRLRFHQGGALLGYLLRQLVRRPRDFVWPPRS